MSLPIASSVLVSNDKKVIAAVSACFKAEEELTVVQHKGGVALIAIESPTLVILDFTDWELGFSVLDEIMRDPWFHHQSIVTISNSTNVGHRVQNHDAISMVASIPRSMISSELPKVLRVMRCNPGILLQRAKCLQVRSRISGDCFLNNDAFEAETMINLICFYLYNLNRIDQAGRNRLRMALAELLINALEHGNCNIGFEEKRDWLSTGKSIFVLMNEKLEDPVIAARKIHFEYYIDDLNSSFVISDEGKGFEWQIYLDKSLNIDAYLGANGRGIVMAQTAVESLEYNAEGNSVSCTIAHNEIRSNEIPAIFQGLHPIVLHKDEVLLQEGTISDSFYFILKGALEEISDEERVRLLTLDNLFVGEDAFLLGSPAPHTIRALSDVQVIRMTRPQFVLVLKQYPRYALFLARLFAQRGLGVVAPASILEEVEA